MKSVDRKVFKNIKIVLVGCALVASPLALGEASSAPQENGTATLEQELGYYYGYSFGNMLKQSQSADVDLESLLTGLKDAVADQPPALDGDARTRMYDVIRQRQAAARAEQEQAVAMQAQAALEASSAFLAENAAREGVSVTASGLQYEVIEDVAGETAGASDVVSVNYRGTFVNGEIFDQSADTPVTFGLQQVIPGWTEGLQLMSPGDRFRFFLPPDLAYGAASVGKIPPNSALIFDVELVSVKRADP